MQQEESRWSEASKDGSLRALQTYVTEFPDSRFRKSAEEASATARAAFKPDNVLIIVKAQDGSDSLLGVWHGVVSFALSGIGIPSFVHPDPRQKNVAIAVHEGSGLIPLVELPPEWLQTH